MTLTLADFFCGAGGSSTGALMVPGVTLKAAANHWDLAIDTHAANHPDAEPASQIHHRKPRGMGSTRDDGTNLAANGLHICLACHMFAEGGSVEHPRIGRMRGSRAQSRINGWLIPREGDAPDEIPMLTVHGWVHLSDDGGMRVLPNGGA